jgi:hypothetical protein
MDRRTKPRRSSKECTGLWKPLLLWSEWPSVDGLRLALVIGTGSHTACSPLVLVSLALYQVKLGKQAFLWENSSPENQIPDYRFLSISPETIANKRLAPYSPK